MTADPIVIASYARTPMGSFQGALSGATAPQLGAAAVKAAVERAGISGERVEKVFMGCVLPGGVGQAPARQAALGAGLPLSAEAVTINKVCGSGMQTAIFAHDMLAANSADVIVAGGMESMTNAPYLMAKHRAGARMGHDKISDSMFLDGLEDAYEAGKLMGFFAEEAASAYQMTRQAQDEFAIQSLERAKKAQSAGAFNREIVAIEVQQGKNKVQVAVDEQPSRGDAAKIPQLKPAFSPTGTVTAANSSSISDGAAALVMARASTAEKLGMKVVARVVAHAAHAQKPALFTSAPVPALKKVLGKAGWNVSNVDLWEVNEAFAIVAMIARQELAIPNEKLNVNGGACALGHPIGASGARILATLISALQERGLKKGVASLCIGGGEATAMALELLN